MTLSSDFSWRMGCTIDDFVIRFSLRGHRFTVRQQTARAVGILTADDKSPLRRGDLRASVIQTLRTDKIFTADVKLSLARRGDHWSPAS